MTPTESRKTSHLAVALDARVQGAGAGLDDIALPYDALFEIPPERLDTRSHIAGIPVRFPLLFGAITGGTPQATAFNTALRALASRHGLALCLGSIRACLEDDALDATYGTGDVDALFANLGATEACRYPPQLVAEKCRHLGCGGLFIHLNGLQEALQVEGNHAFSCPLDALRRFVDAFPLPVLVKEVGSGIGGACARRLATLPIAGIETASLGGTSWVKVEALRRNPQPSLAALDALSRIGYPLAVAIRDCRAALGTRTLIASGGIRTPLDFVKSLALGADLVAIAQPLWAVFHAGGTDALAAFVDEWLDIARLIWRSTGCPDLTSLRHCL